MAAHSKLSSINPPNNKYLLWSLADRPILDSIKALLDTVDDADSHEESAHKAGNFRTQVKDEDRAKDGIYRAILKLILYFMNKATKQPTIRIATGFLVSETEIGTAGHCVYDQEYERLVGVEVYLGYSDKGYDEIRYGDLVTVPSAYVDGQTEDDLAVIRLDEPFQETVTPINWINTPDQMELLEIKVPGFPSDLSVGKIMYEGSQQHVKVNLASSHGMIQYLVDTYGGQSGAPVLWADTPDGPLRAIGVHVRGPPANHVFSCRGSTCVRFNEAVAFGPMGHDFSKLLAFINALPETEVAAKSEHKAIVKPGRLRSQITPASYRGQLHAHLRARIDYSNFLPHTCIQLDSVQPTAFYLPSPVLQLRTVVAALYIMRGLMTPGVTQVLHSTSSTGNTTQELDSQTLWPLLCTARDPLFEKHMVCFPRKIEGHPRIGFASDMRHPDPGKDQPSLVRCIIPKLFSFVLLCLPLLFVPSLALSMSVQGIKAANLEIEALYQQGFSQNCSAKQSPSSGIPWQSAMCKLAPEIEGGNCGYGKKITGQRRLLCKSRH